MDKLLVALAGLAVAMAGAPVRAHHSFAAQFDDKAPVTLKGTLSKMEWLNPHTWIHIDVKDADGKVVTGLLKVRLRIVCCDAASGRLISRLE